MVVALSILNGSTVQFPTFPNSRLPAFAFRAQGPLPCWNQDPTKQFHLRCRRVSHEGQLARLFPASGGIINFNDAAPETFASVGELLAGEHLHKTACALADARMPGGSGLDLPKKLRARGSSMPVIIVTAHDTEEMRAEARQAGMAGYFRKPVDDQALIDAIEWALSERQES